MLDIHKVRDEEAASGEVKQTHCDKRQEFAAINILHPPCNIEDSSGADVSERLLQVHATSPPNLWPRAVCRPQ